MPSPLPPPDYLFLTILLIATSTFSRCLLTPIAAFQPSPPITDTTPSTPPSDASPPIDAVYLINVAAAAYVYFALLFFVVTNSMTANEDTIFAAHQSFCFDCLLLSRRLMFDFSLPPF